MKTKTSFELFRWMHLVVLWLIVMTLGVAIVEVAIGPVLQWLLNDAPYQLPMWDRVRRMALFVAFIGFFAGTASWIYDKKTSGR